MAKKKIVSRGIKELEPRQKRFCEEYIIDLNGAQAAIRAGYSQKTAKEIASALLTKINVVAYLNELKEVVSKKLEITREAVLSEYKKMAFFDIRKIFNEHNALIDIKDFDDDSGASVASVEVDEIFEWDADSKRKIHVGNTVKVKISDKRAALDSICKVLGYNAAERIEVNDTTLQINRTVISKQV